MSFIDSISTPQSLGSAATHDAPSSGAGATRWLALDVFRAIAVLSMIQGHTFTALLEPAAYAGAWVPWYALWHGLTAPMFLMGGGLAYGLVRYGRARAASSGGTGRVLRRAATLIVIGSALQWPRGAGADIWREPAQLSAALSVGPLQLIGACLLVCEALRAALGPARFARASSLLALAIALAAPWAWTARSSERSSLGGWLDGHAGSQFPLLPWAAFFFIGAALSSRRGDGPRPVPGRARRLALLGVLLAGGSYALYRAGVQLQAVYGAHPFWHSNPLYVAFRAGVVLSWLALWAGQEARLAAAFRRWRAGARMIALLARRSLAAYVTHLLVIYGTAFGPGLARHGASLPWSEVAVDLVLVLAITLVTLVCWDRVLEGGVRLSAWRDSRVRPPPAPGARHS